VTEKVAAATSGAPGWDMYAYAHVIATFHLNAIPNTPLRITCSDFAHGFVNTGSPHTWELAAVDFHTNNSADFLVTGGSYRYNGPVPIQYMGNTVQPGGVVGPGYCQVPSFTVPEAYVKVYRGQSVQHGPHFSSLDFTFTPLCPSDINHDGFVNGIDFDTYIEWFEAGDDRADFNADGFMNGIDFDEFVAAFYEGC